MKKWIRLGLCTAVLAAALACTALAAEGAVYGTGAVSYDGEKCSVTYSEGLTDENQYVLLLVTNPQSINDEGVMYIDQAAAADGKVSFEGFIPREWPGDGETWTALLGGEFTDGTYPKKIGTLTFGKGATVTGKVALGATRAAGTHDGAQITLTNSAGTIFRGTSDGDGNYEISGVPIGGNYRLEIKANGFLSYTKNIVTIEEGSVILPTVTLLGGDIDISGFIDGSDMSTLLTNFGDYAYDSTSSEYCDIDGSGYVEGLDLSVFLTNFGEQNTVED